MRDFFFVVSTIADQSHQVGEFGSVFKVGQSLCTTEGIDVVRPEPLRATFRMKTTFKGVVRNKVLYTNARLHALCRQSLKMQTHRTSDAGRSGTEINE